MINLRKITEDNFIDTFNLKLGPGQELDHIDHYMELKMLRWPDLFTYRISCNEALGRVPIPPFIIESFIGNIFKHGLIPGQRNEIRVTVSQVFPESAEAEKGTKKICIRIEDSGPGFSEDSLSNYFIKLFKTQFGITPREFRKTNRQNG